jgi:hypothetical protein
MVLAGEFKRGVETITLDLQRNQFDSSGQMQLKRPDKVRVSRTGYTL